MISLLPVTSLIKRMPIHNAYNVDCDSRPKKERLSSGSLSPVESLLNHPNELTNNKYVKCPECGKYFQRLCNMKSHYKIHQVTRPFSCSRCDQHFLRKHDLNRHEKIHKGVKSYFCRRCKKGFIRKDALRRHENMVPEVMRFRCVFQVEQTRE